MEAIKFFFIIALIGTLIFSLPVSAPGQSYPDKPITVYCSYAAGATTDLTTRSLAEGVEKVLVSPWWWKTRRGARPRSAPAW